ncbi:hypothetical protein [Streptococcus parauberis]|uniref:hypothetical protein n=1 Tax=Streptococcus parauberis TaxID=1348 RepID=UPI0002EA36FB|nr:hypothetical protein [Streptococcus parauberis]QBX17877.1 hypothetical protein Javan383_0032 [Streptococcus phage Javan383]UWM90198.1 hypothetical protein N2A94_06780 [Streptococcus parauberis]
MNEELGVLKSINGQYVDIDTKSGLCFGVDDFNNAMLLTRKEAEQFPQFKWVSLEEIK